MNILAEFVDGRVKVEVGDITCKSVHVVVNAANEDLLGGGGVDEAIHCAGGPAILEECIEIRESLYPNGLPTGEAVLTTAGEMPALHVIHTVGPIYSNSVDDPDLLGSCYRNSLLLASEQGLVSIAFPSISTGIYGFPRDEAAVVSSRAIQEFLYEESKIEQVWLVFFTSDDAEMFLQNQVFDK